MRKLQLVTLEYPSNIKEGIFVVPIPGSGINFPIGIVKEIDDEGIYVKLAIENDIVRVLYTKLQPVKLYLVDQEEFLSGDWYYYPPIPIPKKPIKWRDYSPRIGEIKKTLDARLFNLGPAKKIIYRHEQIAWTRAKSDTFESFIGELVPIDARVLGRTLSNNGECWVEELIDGKVVIDYEQL